MWVAVASAGWLWNLKTHMRSLVGSADRCREGCGPALEHFVLNSAPALAQTFVCSPGTWESHAETAELVLSQGRVGPAGDEEEEEEEELSSSCEEEGEEDRDADEEGEGDEDTPTSDTGSCLAARNPYALLGEGEC